MIIEGLSKALPGDQWLLIFDYYVDAPTLANDAIKYAIFTIGNSIGSWEVQGVAFPVIEGKAVVSVLIVKKAVPMICLPSGVPGQPEVCFPDTVNEAGWDSAAKFIPIFVGAFLAWLTLREARQVIQETPDAAANFGFGLGAALLLGLLIFTVAR